MSDRSTWGEIGRGVVAGFAGTAVMTAAQTAYYEATDAEPSDAPGTVAKRVIAGVLQRNVPAVSDDVLNQGMHFLYGTSLGTLHALAVRRPTLGLAFGAGVWGWSLVELPLLKLAPPVWEQPPSAIPADLGFHLVYGVAVAATHRLLH